MDQPTRDPLDGKNSQNVPTPGTKTVWPKIFWKTLPDEYWNAGCHSYWEKLAGHPLTREKVIEYMDSSYRALVLLNGGEINDGYNGDDLDVKYH